MVDVAQLVRALDCGPRGREFESLLPPHFVGVSPSGKALDFDSSTVGSNPATPATIYFM